MNPNEIAFRPMLPSDVRSVAEIVTATPLWQRYGVTFESFVARLNEGLESKASIIVAERSGEILGFVWAVEKGAFNRDVYIPLIGVRPTDRAHGLGALLLDHVEKALFSGPRDVFLLVSDFNDAAQRFYKRQGYVQVGALPNYVLEGVSELVMWKRRPQHLANDQTAS